MPIRFLYFDLGNVLLNFCHDRMCRQMAEAAGLEVQRVRDLVLSDSALRRHETGGLTPVTFHEFFCRESGACISADALHAAAADIFTPNTAMLPLIDKLLAAGHRLGILSNTNEVHWRFITSGRFAPLLPGPFEHAILSYEVQSMKPDREIYEAAARRADVPPHEIFFTDDRAENVAGARAAGFDAVLFTNAEQLTEELAARGIRV